MQHADYRYLVLAPLAAGLFAGLAASPAEASTYRFRISCEHGTTAVEWRTGDLDPGREYFRVVTGTKNPNCSISDFDDVADAGLPIEVYARETAVVQSVPFLGSLLCKLFCPD